MKNHKRWFKRLAQTGQQLKYRVKWHVLPKLKLVSKYPTHIDIEPTNACNLKCKMCERDFMDSDIGYMDWELYKTIIYQYTPCSIKLNWRGEPLLHKSLVAMISFAKSRGVHEVSLNTNGLLLTKEWIDYFCRLNHSDLPPLTSSALDWLIISVDGATKETYESIRQGGNFETLFKNIVYASNNFKGRIRLQICPQEANLHEIESGLWLETFEPYADELRLGKLHDPQGKHGYKVEIPHFCTSLWQRLTIGWNGDIYPCPSAFESEWKLGNIKDTTIYDAWHSNRMEYFRYILSHYGRKYVPLCQNCSSYC